MEDNTISLCLSLSHQLNILKLPCNERRNMWVNWLCNQRHDRYLDFFLNKCKVYLDVKNQMSSMIDSHDHSDPMFNIRYN